jgi:sugar O-acyltransferase (sialic acid O-acetyltransferase NeuD family)
MSQRLLIIGAGGHGRSVAEAVSLRGDFEIVGFVDDGAAVGDVFGNPILGPISRLDELKRMADSVVVAIGRNTIREELFNRARALGYRLPVITHPASFVSPSAVLGAGTVVMAGAQVGVEAVIGQGVIVNTSAVVDHHCVVEDFGHLGTNACMAGGAVLGRGAWMQAGSAIGYTVRVAASEVLEVGESRQPGAR